MEPVEQFGWTYFIYVLVEHKICYLTVAATLAASAATVFRFS